jgi:hypothetical protein
MHCQAAYLSDSFWYGFFPGRFAVGTWMRGPWL